MSQKTTPDKNVRRRLDPRKLNLDADPCSSNGHDNRKNKPGKRSTNKLYNAASSAIVNTSRSRPSNICPTYPPPVYYPYSPPIPIYTHNPPYASPMIPAYPYTHSRYTVVPQVVTPVHSPLYPPVPVNHVPMNALPIPIYNSQACPYSSLIGSPIIASQPSMHLLSPMAASVAPADYSFSQGFESAFYEQPRPIPRNVASYTTVIDEVTHKLQTSPIRSKEEFKPMKFESYFLLPKDLFQPARLFDFNINALIDEFCKLPDLNQILPWVLDLEYGVPKVPVIRPIAVYDAKFNSIHCKNTPGAIHPGFESCSDEFKSIFLYYYDTVVSSWYKGFILLNSDRSVVNFQSWLEVPMRSIGMCWP